jgi:dienelactone hydrolase
MVMLPQDQGVADGMKAAPSTLATVALGLALCCAAFPAFPGAAANATPAQVATGFVALLARGDFNGAESEETSALQQAAPAATLERIWNGLSAQLGAFQRQAGASETAAGAYENVTVSCIFAHGTADLLVTVDASERIAGLHLVNVKPAPAYSPPGYVHPASFHERAVTVGHAPWALPGTLTLPNGRGPFPAVVLVAGSGPDDRNETVGADEPFRDIAWGLASRGIAVLRYDKRTLVYGAKIAALTQFTVQDEFVTDAKAAVSLLSGLPRIDHHHIYVLGHSEGGMMAPEIARQDSHVAGIIIAAGPTRPFVDVYVSQIVYLQSRGLATAAQVAAAKKAAAQIKALTPAGSGRAGDILGAPASYWLYLRGYHDTAVAQKLTIPMLIMQGARDYQVTLTDYRGWRKALAGKSHVTFKRYAGLFHPFIPVPAGNPPGLATPAAYNQPGHVSPTAIRDLASWIESPAPQAR